MELPRVDATWARSPWKGLDGEAAGDKCRIPGPRDDVLAKARPDISRVTTRRRDVKPQASLRRFHNSAVTLLFPIVASADHETRPHSPNMQALGHSPRPSTGGQLNSDLAFWGRYA